MTRALVLIVVCAACSRHPDGVPTPASEPSWARVDITECGFSVELPGPVTRTVQQPAPDLPATYMYTAPATHAGLLVECTPFGPGVLPADHAHVISEWSERRRRNLAGLAGGITSSKVAPEPSGDAARFAIHFAQGKTDEGRMVIAGDQIRELSGLTDGGHETRRDLDRLLASYR